MIFGTSERFVLIRFGYLNKRQLCFLHCQRIVLHFICILLSVGMCPKDLLHTTVLDSCTFKHGANCSYSCGKFYIPASEDSTILCLYGEWSHSVPCVFSSKKSFYYMASDEI